MRIYSRDADIEFSTGYTGGGIQFTGNTAEVDDELGARLVLEFPHLFGVTRSVVIEPVVPVAPVPDAQASVASPSAPSAPAKGKSAPDVTPPTDIGH